VTEFLILPGHHLYKMDYQKIIKAHRKREADITIAALSVLRDQDTGFGFLEVNSENQVLEFRLKSESEPISLVSFFHQSPLFRFYHFSRCSLMSLCLNSRWKAQENAMILLIVIFPAWEYISLTEI
jgi:glucose-1-phosphate adenylyltransferase